MYCGTNPNFGGHAHNHLYIDPIGLFGSLSIESQAVLYVALKTSVAFSICFERESSMYKTVMMGLYSSIHPEQTHLSP